MFSPPRTQDGISPIGAKSLALGSTLPLRYAQWLRSGTIPWGLRWFAWKANRFFFTTGVACCLCLTLIAIWPVLREFLASTGFINLADSGPHHVKPLHRTTFFRLCIAWMIFASGHYGLCFHKAHRIHRTLALLAWLVYAVLLILVNNQLLLGQCMIGEVASRRVFDQQLANIEKLKIIEYPTVTLHAYEVREELRKLEVPTFADFHRCVMEQYEADLPRLKKRWGSVADLNEQKLKTLFIMNFVAGLWSFGNQTNVEKPGCVFCNEQNRWESRAPSFQGYLDAQIGCCTDFAYLTKSLLDHENIENRLTSISGHIFNEVRLGGRWCILDATVNIFVERSWEELYHKDHARESIHVLVFQHPNLADERSNRYRALAGHFRLLTLVRIANHPEHLRKTEHPSLPAYFD